MPTYLTTTEAAVELGVTRCRVRALIASGRLRAERHGRDWMIRPHWLEPVRIRRPGRPGSKKKKIV